MPGLTAVACLRAAAAKQHHNIPSRHGKTSKQALSLAQLILLPVARYRVGSRHQLWPPTPAQLCLFLPSCMRCSSPLCMANLQALHPLPACQSHISSLHPPPQSRSQVIVVYRDGVSESFYDQVLATEFTAIKEVRVGNGCGLQERPWVPSLHSGAGIHTMHAAHAQFAVNSLLQSD